MSPNLIHSRQRGAMLIEGLIAILIFSIGILSLVGLLGTSLKTTGDAKYRADASHLANQIIGSMWVDRANLSAYSHYATAGGTVCTPSGTASANANVTTWVTDVQSFLPGAAANRLQITIDANNVVQVTVCWQGPQESSPHNFVATAQING